MSRIKYISVVQAQAFDRFAQEKLGIPSLILMENAGRSVAEEALKMLGKKEKAAVICGVGNNGGDGLVAARHLLNAGKKVSVYLIGEISKLKLDPKTNLNILKKMGQEIYFWKPRRYCRRIPKTDLIIDAIFGIGLNSEIREPYASIIRFINAARRPVLAVDVPSGLNADTGEVLGVAVKAKRTVTFVAPKKGFSRRYGPKCCGKVIVRDIGII